MLLVVLTTARYRVLVSIAFALGVYERARDVVSASFPLGDGGLFFTMAQELQAAHFRLPAFSAYNSLGIPFAYPPVGLYLAALVDALTPLSLLDAFRLLPLLAACLTLPAAWLLICDLALAREVRLAAIAAFALMPTGYVWLIVGGGVTRSPSFLFALLSLHCLHRAF